MTRQTRRNLRTSGGTTPKPIQPVGQDATHHMRHERNGRPASWSGAAVLRSVARAIRVPSISAAKGHRSGLLDGTAPESVARVTLWFCEPRPLARSATAQPSAVDAIALGHPTLANRMLLPKVTSAACVCPFLHVTSISQGSGLAGGPPIDLRRRSRGFQREHLHPTD